MGKDWGEEKEILRGGEIIAVVNYWAPLMYWIWYWPTSLPTSVYCSVSLIVVCIPQTHLECLLRQRDREREMGGWEEIDFQGFTLTGKILIYKSYLLFPLNAIYFCCPFHLEWAAWFLNLPVKNLPIL